MSFFNKFDRVLVIAEACDNHMGSMDNALLMCDRAKASGADYIKFQHHLPDEEMLPTVPMSDNFDEPLYEFLLKNALNLAEHKQLRNYCQDIGIGYLCTPFSAVAAQQIVELEPDFLKIGSGEFCDFLGLEKISKLKVPLMLSTGMCSETEIFATVSCLRKWEVDFALLNCVSEYPPVYEDVNIAYIKRMKLLFPDIVIGHSDHTPDLFTSFAAVSIGARVIEKHVILDKKMPGPDQQVSIDFDDLAVLVDGIRKIELATGEDKFIHEREHQIREWAHRSLVTAAEIKKGDILSQSNITSKRPGNGIPSASFEMVFGRKAKRALPGNALLSWEDII